MAHENKDDGLIRRYLLGQLAEDELEQLEERMMADTEFFNAVLLAEDEMVEDYVQRELPSSDVVAFEASFLSTPEGRQQVAYGKALNKFVQNISPSPDPTVLVREEPVANAAAPERPVTEEPSNHSEVPRLVWWRRPALVPYLAAAAAVSVIGLAVGTWQIMSPSAVSKGITTLAYAYREQRPLEARISGFAYAPLSSTRGGEPKVDRTARNLAESVLLEEVLKHPNAATHHAAGRLYLAEKKFDEAVEQFEEALKEDPNNAQLHSDLGAALLEKGKDDQSRGEAGKSFEEFAKSDEQLSKALELDGSLIEALFNRGLSHEYMLLYRSAEEDWKSYLAKDSTSKWADEARQRLQELETRTTQTSRNVDQPFEDLLDASRTKDSERTWQIVTQNRNLNGSFIESRLIDSYLDLTAQGRDDEARKSLNVLSYVGDVGNEHSRDRFVSDLARFYQQATPAQLNGISRARVLLKLARGYYSKTDFDAALQSYRKAKSEFELVGASSEATYIDYMMGGCYLGQSKPESMLALFQALALDCEKAGYTWLLAQTLTALSNTDQYFRDFSAAISHTNRSLRQSEAVGDSIGILNSRYQLGEIYRFLNNGPKALEIYVRDLPLARTLFPLPGQLWARYFSISRVFDQLDLETAAVDFQNEALQLAVEAKAPRLICRSHNFLGSMLAKSGDYPRAVTSIDKAIEIGNSLPGRAAQLEATAFSYLQLASVYRKARDFDKAIENSDKAIRSYDELGLPFFAFTARKDRLLCCIEQSGCPTVKQELEGALSRFEDQRAKILEDGNRTTFFDGEQSVYDLAIEFEYYREGNTRQAFDYAERSRARSLGDLINPRNNGPDRNSGQVNVEQTSQPLDAEQIQKRMPEQAQILQYVILKNSVLIWVLSKDKGLSQASQAITADDLNKRVNHFLQLLSGNAESDLEAFNIESIDLYDLLIKPVEDRIDRGKVLCIVPDKILHYLPFGALLSQVSRRYLIEEQDLMVSPSASMFIHCSDFARAKESAKSETMTVVGNPAFDRREFSDLADLSAAANEAAAIAALYGTRAITGTTATKKRVVSEMENSDVIHLATHAITDEWDPLRSKLLLARDASSSSRNEDDGVLQALEIYRLDLARVRLVVLSACRTGVEKYYGGEGMIGLSRPFIANRIPLVVASLWPVDSGVAARLMTSFHRLRKTKSEATAHALCNAQREMMRRSNSNDSLPRNWAAFVTIGGYASF